MVGSDILPSAETAIRPSNGSHHAHAVLPGLEVVIHIGREFEPIEMPTNQSIGVILRVPWEYLPIASPSPIVL